MISMPRGKWATKSPCCHRSHSNGSVPFCLAPSALVGRDMGNSCSAPPFTGAPEATALAHAQRIVTMTTQNQELDMTGPLHYCSQTVPGGGAKECAGKPCANMCGKGMPGGGPSPGGKLHGGGWPGKPMGGGTPGYAGGLHQPVHNQVRWTGALQTWGRRLRRAEFSAASARCCSLEVRTASWAASSWAGPCCNLAEVLRRGALAAGHWVAAAETAASPPSAASRCARLQQQRQML